MLLETLYDGGRDHVHCSNDVGTECYTNTNFSEGGCGFVNGRFDVLGMWEEANSKCEAGEATANNGDIDGVFGGNIRCGDRAHFVKFVINK